MRSIPVCNEREMMNIPRESIQPPAEQLVTYTDFVEHLQTLSKSPRVKVQRLGQTHEGRGLFAIVISDEQAQPHLDYYRNLAIGLERPQVVHPTLGNPQQTSRPVPPADMRYPVLILAQTFGHEAAHVEALLQLADMLAWSNDTAVGNILSKLIVV